ncbi:SurA N-terminal domain-containing protein [Paralimibaculum aggregatum]|uniref:Parvulin-like PPIase n=1 Tax=Paralimibaculum aggregatum TaxID=3036245 RepID=A0ABQ6LPI4_9RHOB|nr:peptidylprolyl isomerase [Limibaculum sp. NKW23]GMG83677.1 SurA N-terminal domain-containing protein [Limibaculum sp. NKW23]
MLEFLRKGAKSWVAKILILLLIASFAVWGISDVFTTSSSSAVARIGDEKVTVEAYADELVRQRARLSRQAGRAISFAEMRETGLDQLVLAQLARFAMVKAELDALGLAAPDDAVAEEIRNQPGFQGAGGFSAASYRSWLAQQGYSPAQFEALTRVAVGQSMLDEAAAGTGTAPPGMGPRIAAYQGERRSVAVVVLPEDRAPEPGEPGEGALEAQYEADPAAYTEPERRAGLYLHIDVEAMAEELAPGEEAIEDWYADHGDTFGETASRVIDQLPLPADEAEALAERLRSGETDFEALATELGENPADLDLGRVVEGDLPEAVEAAVFAATEPGIVGPVAAPTGPVLVRIREVVEGGTPPLEEVRDVIAARLAHDAALDRAPDLANRIEELRAGGRNLEEIAAETGIALGRFEGLAESGALPDGDVADGIVGTDAFLTEVFAAIDHEERDLIETPAGGYFLVLVERIAESRLLPLEEVRDRVLADWQAEERHQALEAEAAALVERLAGPARLTDWAEEQGLTVTEHYDFPRDAAPATLPFALTSELFALPEGHAAYLPLDPGQGVILAEVTAVTPLGPEQTGLLSGRIDMAIGAQLSQDQAELMARALESSFETSVDPAAVETVFDLIGAARPGS